MSKDDEIDTVAQAAAAAAAYPVLTKEIVLEILQSEAPYCDSEEQETCRRMVNELTEEERTTAACTSYAYWFALTFFTTNDDDSQIQVPSTEDTMRMAMREARRHLVGSSGDEAVALGRLRRTCQFRKERRLDLFRELYPSSMHGHVPKEGAPEQEELKATFRSYVEQELTLKQPFFVRGQDRDHRAMIVKRGRVSPETLHEAYENNHFYIAERAIATTEFLSRGKEEKVLVIMDFEGYSSSNAPPLWTQKETISLMITHYPERLAGGIVTEPAFWMRALYNVIYPLLSEDTNKKIQMVYGEGKHETIRTFVDPQHAMPFMMPDGHLTSDVEPDTFLKLVPFYCHYDA